MVRLSSSAEVQALLASARDIGVFAYTLRRGPMLSGLEAAARRGAHVSVRLEGTPFGDPDGSFARANRRIADELARCGVDARLAHTGADSAQQAPLHAKAVVADGRLFLDDRNWGRSDFVVCDGDRGDVRAVRDALEEDAPSIRRPAFAFAKRDALASEARLLCSAQADDDVIVESESFGNDNPVYAALEALAKGGATPRLLVSSREAASNRREQNALERLSRDGVAVRLCPDSEKFALAGRRAWIGSANASPAFGHPDMIDWGLRTDDRTIVAAARDRVEARWNAASPLKADR
jgi:phosphatidylserine/phosphatidylglycerophosphate/cardiolipin synthase-like enzyme